MYTRLILSDNVDAKLPPTHPIPVNTIVGHSTTVPFVVPSPELDWLLENLPGRLEVRYDTPTIFNDICYWVFPADGYSPKYVPLEDFAALLLATPSPGPKSPPEQPHPYEVDSPDEEVSNES